MRVLSALIGFQGIVYELTLDPRPASPGTTVPSRNQSPPVQLSHGPVYSGRPWRPNPFLRRQRRRRLMWSDMARCASRLASRSAIDCRLSQSRLPVAIAISTLAYPSEK